MDSYKYEVPLMASAKWHVFTTLPVPTVFPRDASGKPGLEYKTDDCPHLFQAINACRAMLYHQKVRDALERIAVRYKAAQPNSWWLQGSNCMSTTQVADTFVRKIISTFPRVFVDYSLEYPNYRGSHTRRPWGGDFRPEHQGICINGKVSGTRIGSLDLGP